MNCIGIDGDFGLLNVTYNRARRNSRPKTKNISASVFLPDTWN